MMRTSLLQKTAMYALPFPRDESGAHESPPERKTKTKAREESAALVDNQLQLPLFESGDVAKVLDSVLTDEAFDSQDAISYIPSLDDLGEDFEWTEEDLVSLHSELLEQSLRALAGRSNGKQKREILDWIFEPDYVATVVKDGVERRIYTSDIPFTFAYCCLLERITDPDRIRNFVRQHLPEGTAKYH